MHTYMNMYAYIHFHFLTRTCCVRQKLSFKRDLAFDASLEVFDVHVEDLATGITDLFRHKVATRNIYRSGKLKKTKK